MLNCKFLTILVIGLTAFQHSSAGKLGKPHKLHGRIYDCRTGVNGIVCRNGVGSPPLDPALVKVVIRLKDGKDCVQTCRVGANGVWYCDTKGGPGDGKPFKIQVPDPNAPFSVVVKECIFQGQDKWECRSVNSDPAYQCDLLRSSGAILCKVNDGRTPNAEVPNAFHLKVSIPNRLVDVPLTCSKNGQHLVCSPKNGYSRPLILMNGLDVTLPSPTGRLRYACSLARGNLVCSLKPDVAHVSQLPILYEISVPTKDGGYEEIVCKDEGDRLICTYEDLATKTNVVGSVKCLCDKNGHCNCVSTDIRSKNAGEEFDILVPDDRAGSHEWVCIKKKRTTTVRRTVRMTNRRTTTKKCCPCAESHEHQHRHHNRGR